MKTFVAHLHIKQHCLQNKKPNFVVAVNGIVQNNTEITNIDLIIFKMLLNFGPNTVSISLLNKDLNDTIIDANGKIIQDLAIQIDKFEVDDFNLSSYTKNSALYTTDDGGVEKTYGFMHKNGQLTINIICPTFYSVRNAAVIKQ